MADEPSTQDECREILGDLARYLDGECQPDLEHVVTAHLAACPPCTNRADFERHIRSLVARCCREQAPPDVLYRLEIRLGQL